MAPMTPAAIHKCTCSAAAAKRKVAAAKRSLHKARHPGKKAGKGTGKAPGSKSGKTARAPAKPAATAKAGKAGAHKPVQRSSKPGCKVSLKVARRLRVIRKKTAAANKKHGVVKKRTAPSKAKMKKTAPAKRTTRSHGAVRTNPKAC